MIITPKPAKQTTKEATWRQTISDWEKSGHSVVAFCKQRKLTTSAFYNWRHKIKALDAKSSHPTKEKDNLQSHPISFLPITVTDKASNSSATLSHIEVAYPNGCILRLNNSFDTSVLYKINKAMGVISC